MSPWARFETEPEPPWKPTAQRPRSRSWLWAWLLALALGLGACGTALQTAAPCNLGYLGAALNDSATKDKAYWDAVDQSVSACERQERGAEVAATVLGIAALVAAATAVVLSIRALSGAGSTATSCGSRRRRNRPGVESPRHTHERPMPRQ